jgi:hypothetical protein
MSVLLCPLVPIQGRAESAALSPGAPLHQSINIDDGRRPIDASWVRAAPQKYRANRFDRFVIFLPLVSSYSEPVSDQKPDEKGGSTDAGAVERVAHQKDEKVDWVHFLWPPIVWFIIGVLIGGGFGRSENRTRVAPNAPLHPSPRSDAKSR